MLLAAMFEVPLFALCMHFGNRVLLLMLYLHKRRCRCVSGLPLGVCAGDGVFQNQVERSIAFCSLNMSKAKDCQG